MLIFLNRLRYQPVQFGAAADKALGQVALMGGAGLDLWQRRVVGGIDCLESAVRALQIGRQ